MPDHRQQPHRVGDDDTAYKRLDLSMTLIRPVCVWLDNRGLLVTGNGTTDDCRISHRFQLLAQAPYAIVMIAHPSKRRGDGSGSAGSTAWFATDAGAGDGEAEDAERA
jgi:hypothetical protein